MFGSSYVLGSLARPTSQYSFPAAVCGVVAVRTGSSLSHTPHDLTGTDLRHNDADHHPKYYVVRWIKRVC